jgi:hypothetical protein
MFYLGTDMPNWVKLTDVPLFVSYLRILGRCKKTIPQARGPVAIDSGGFTMIKQNGCWTIGPRQYAVDFRRIREEMGRDLTGQYWVRWAPCQDWMCEAPMLERTGKTVIEHQELTLRSYLDLMNIDPELPWVPVLQGYEPSEYYRHIDMYMTAGVDLTKLPLVGLGSICRRQNTHQAEKLIRALKFAGLRLHGFGLKKDGLKRISALLESSDSLAWSFGARKSKLKLPGCTHRAQTCAHCLRYSHLWREQVLAASASTQQLVLTA